jgi:hypothetical protein
VNEHLDPGSQGSSLTRTDVNVIVRPFPATTGTANDRPPRISLTCPDCRIGMRCFVDYNSRWANSRKGSNVAHPDGTNCGAVKIAGMVLGMMSSGTNTGELWGRNPCSISTRFDDAVRWQASATWLQSSWPHRATVRGVLGTVRLPFCHKRAEPFGCLIAEIGGGSERRRRQWYTWVVTSLCLHHEVHVSRRGCVGQAVGGQGCHPGLRSRGPPYPKQEP